jgi:hypothetical protein
MLERMPSYASSGSSSHFQRFAKSSFNDQSMFGIILDMMARHLCGFDEGSLYRHKAHNQAS